MKKKLLGTAALSALFGAVGLVAPHAPAHAEATQYAFSGNSYGTRVVGGDLPAGNGKTVLSVLGCTTQAPRLNENRGVAAAPAGVPISASVVHNSNRTTAVDGGYAMVSRSRVSDLTVTLPVGAFTLNGLDVKAVAAFVDDQPAPRLETSVGNAQISLPPAPPLDVPINQLRQGFVVPGVMRVKLLDGRTTGNADRATASAVGLRIYLVESDTKTSVGVANARIGRVSGRGPFAGGAQVGEGVIRGEDVRIGPVISRPMPCRGTDGKWVAEDVARANLGDVAEVRAARGKVYSTTYPRGGAKASSVAFADRISAVDDRLRVGNIVARATVQRSANGPYEKRASFELGRIVIDGNIIEAPDPGNTLTVPGVARISVGIENRGRGSIGIVAMRIELLDGSLATIDVATARAKVS